jgi:hypothetical protein
VLALALAGVIALGCLPSDETPGTWLRGDDIAERVSDWRFSDAIEEIYIETQPWYGIAHSTTIWCVTVDGALYVGSYGAEKKRWEQNIARRPEARLQIDGRLYEVTLAPVTDEQLVSTLDVAYETKYDMAEVFGEDVPRWWYYAVTQRHAPVASHPR